MSCSTRNFMLVSLKSGSFSAAMVDRTTYDAARTPDLPLRQVFGRQRLSPDLCKLVADRRLLTVETFAMLGDNIAEVKRTLQTMIPTATDLGPDGPSQELALTSLAAVWKTCSTMQDHFAARRARMRRIQARFLRSQVKIMQSFEKSSLDDIRTCSSHIIESHTASSSSEFNATSWSTAP